MVPAVIILKPPHPRSNPSSICQQKHLRLVFDLNLMGTILPSQVFGKIMAEQKSGVILNISSMNAFRPLTRIAAYSAAKAGVSNFTQWLAVHMAQEYSPEIRVNAIAPGFFVTEQNRFLLTDKDTSESDPPRAHHHLLIHPRDDSEHLKICWVL